MNLALATVLLFLFILPGITFRFSYYSYPFSYSAMSTNLLNELYFSIFPAIVLQYIGITAVTNIWHFPPRFDIWGYLLLPTNNTDVIKTSFLCIQDSTHSLFLYNLLINGLSSIFGLISKFFVLKFNLDLKTKYLTFPNRWYYLFSGRISGIDGDPEAGNVPKKIELVIIDVLCNIGSNNFIYSGMLYDYYLNNEGGLDGLTLMYTQRFQINSDNTVPIDSFDIKGDYLYISYKEIKNINIRYYNLDEPRLSDGANG